MPPAAPFWSSPADFDAALRALPGSDTDAIAAAAARQAQLTKPAGSLARLEQLALFFAGWQGRAIPALDQGRVLIFAGNHGVTVHGVSAFPATVTAQMVANFNAGGAAINALAAAASLDLRVVPIDLDRPTADFTQGAAMSEADCLAALAIQRVFDQADSHGPLNGFSVGLGIAHGRAIAGQIGTQDLAKIGVFGPVVNQGARLESMTRQFDVSIIVDEATAEAVRKHLPTSVASVRKLAHVRPKGMDIPVVVYELVSGDADVSPDHLQFESALEHIVSGNWDEAMNLLETAPDDGPGNFLIQQIRECGGAPPVDWDGAFRLTRK